MHKCAITNLYDIGLLELSPGIAKHRSSTELICNPANSGSSKLHFLLLILVMPISKYYTHKYFLRLTGISSSTVTTVLHSPFVCHCGALCCFSCTFTITCTVLRCAVGFPLSSAITLNTKRSFWKNRDMPKKKLHKLGNLNKPEAFHSCKDNKWMTGANFSCPVRFHSAGKYFFPPSLPPSSPPPPCSSPAWNIF